MGKTYKTVCPRDCYDACGMTVITGDKGQIISLKGEKEHPVTQGFLCPRGNKDLQRLVTNRVEQPYLRKNGKLRPVSWDEALDTVANKIKSLGTKTDRILYVDYAGNEGLANNIFVRRLWYALGATFSDGALCTTSGHEALFLHYGTSYGVFPEEFLTKKLIVFWGANPAVTGPHIWKMALDARKTNNAKIVVIDPLMTKTAKQADLFLQPYPGTDTALAYAVMNEMITNNLYDKDFVEKHTTGFEALKDKANEWNAEKAEKFTGIDKRKIRALTELYGQAGDSVTMIGVGLQKRINGFEHVRAVSLIPALAGVHRGFFYSNSRSLSVDTSLISGKKLVKKSGEVSQIAIGSHLLSGNFSVLVVNSTNLAVTHPDSRAIIKAMKSKELFSVVFETHWSETAKLADVILPAPTFLEKQDVMLSWGHQYTRNSPQIIKPMYGSRPEWQIMHDLARRLEIKENFVFENPFDVIKKAFKGAIESAEQDFMEGKDTLVKLKTKPKDYYPTPSGKIEFASSTATAKGLEPLPVQPVFNRGKDKFILLTTATAKYTNSQFREVYGPNKPYIYICPEDAREKGLEDGQEVYVANRDRMLRLKVKTADFLQKGVAWIPRFTDDLDGQPMNILIEGLPQTLGHGPTMHSTEVGIKAIK